MSDGVTEKVEKFFSKFPERQYPKGQILIFAGDEPTYVYYLKEGKVRQYDISYKGDEVVLNVFKPDAFFPMSTAILDTPNKFFFDAETAVLLRQAPAKKVVKFIIDNPDVMYDLITRVYRGTEGLLGRMAYLMTGSAQSRLVYELIIEAHRFGKRQKDKSVMLVINEKSLGTRVGLSRETVSREIHKLKSQKLLEISRVGIRIFDTDKLAEKLGAEI